MTLTELIRVATQALHESSSEVDPEVVIYCPDAPRPVGKIRLHPTGNTFIIEVEI